jgi:hypothetical protein
MATKANASELEPKKAAAKANGEDVEFVRVLPPGYIGALNTGGRKIEPGDYTRNDPAIKGLVNQMVHVGRAVIIGGEVEPTGDPFADLGFDFSRERLERMVRTGNKTDIMNLARRYRVKYRSTMEPDEIAEAILDAYVDSLTARNEPVPEWLEGFGTGK